MSRAPHSRPVIIRGGTVLVGSPLRGRFVAADVLVNDGVIVAIGPQAALPPFEQAEVIDAAGTYVLPGFVDSHQHLWEASLKGVCTDGSLADFFFRVSGVLAGAHTPDDLLAGITAGALATIDGGTTTVLDHFHAVNSPAHAEAALAAVQASGLRVKWSYGTKGTIGADSGFNTQEERWQNAREVRTAHFSAQTDLDRVTMGLAIADTGSYGWDTTPLEYRLADELDLLLTTHANCFWGAKKQPAFAQLHRHGLLGARQLYSHATSTSDEELRLLADAGASLASTPETELVLGVGFPVFQRAFAAGVATGLGSDIQALNSPDLFNQMRIGLNAVSAHVHHAELERGGSAAIQRPAVTVRDMYHLATLGGAQAIGLGDVTGSLEIGKAADIVLLRHDGIHQQPNVDPFALIVQYSSTRDVDTVLIDGAVLKRGGRLPQHLVESAAAQNGAAFERLSTIARTRGGLRFDSPPGLLGSISAAVGTNLT